MKPKFDAQIKKITLMYRFLKRKGTPHKMFSSQIYDCAPCPLLFKLIFIMILAYSTHYQNVFYKRSRIILTTTIMAKQMQIMMH